MKPQDVWVVGLQELFFLVLVISHFSTMGMYYIYRFSKKKKEEKTDGVTVRLEKDFHTQITPTWIKGSVQTSSLSN